MNKFIMKNIKTGQYWCSDKYPQVCADVWGATQFDSAALAQSALRHLMADKYTPTDFKPVKITLTENLVE